MDDFFRDYGTQLALAIAGINTIISLVIGQYFKDNPRWRIALVIASVALIGLGVGASFYSQHQIEVSANVEKEKRIAMKDVLGGAINECASLNVKKRTESQEDVDAYANDAGELATKTRNLIAQAYGEGEANLFMNDAGIPGMASPGHPNVLMRSEMIARIQRLNELISRVDTITMRPGFDPRNYHPK
jgi:hypothetical protein